MTWARFIRQLLPGRLQPPARYQYERWRGQLEPELPLVCRTIEPGQRVIDIGASVGVYTHALHRRGALVEAFEPQPSCLETLRAYAAAHSQVRVYPVALGSKKGRATLHVPVIAGRLLSAGASLAKPQEASERISVDVHTLDSYEFSDVALIKIDVEGAELDVLRGAAKTIARSKPVLLVEIERRHHSGPINSVFSFITEMGYNGSFLDRSSDSFRSIDGFDADAQQQLDASRQPTGVYINNFLFTPTDSSRGTTLVAT
jgi:FkbM family methyltransferase